MVEPRLGFWGAVQDCLVEFHKWPRDRAAERVLDLWRHLSAAGPAHNEPGVPDMIYHAEPWYIACNLAGTELRLAPDWPAYKAILTKHGLAALISV